MMSPFKIKRTGMIPFSLVQPFLSPNRRLRALILSDTLCVTWQPRLFLTKNVDHFRLGFEVPRFGFDWFICDKESERVAKGMAALRRPVNMIVWWRFTIYRFGSQRSAAT